MKQPALRCVAIALILAASAVTSLADAQGFPGGRGQGKGGNRSSSESGDPAAGNKRSPSGNQTVSEPALALERELPSLRSDLLLMASQLEAWTAFERSVRDAAQVAHARQRRAAEQRQNSVAGGVDLPPGAAIASLQAQIDDERNRAELLANVVTMLDALARSLDTRQSGMINRRVVQALGDPLGPS